jgi:3-oxoacyl-[acyl-carrier-protein] synthase II
LKKRVVVTGIGAVTPLGLNAKSTWQGVIEGRSGINHITLFDASTFPVRIAGEVKGFHSNGFEFDPYLVDFMSRATKFSFAATQMALEDSKLNLKDINSTRFGISLGTNEEHVHLDQIDEVYGDVLTYQALVSRSNYYFDSSKPLGRIWPIRRTASISSYVLSLIFNARGPINTSVTACASSGHAIGRAMRIIESGETDVMIAGGCESMISEFAIAGFGLLRALSRNNDEPEKASRPFDRKRDGFVLSEGAGILILEELSHAQERGANILAELTGYGSSSNAYRITDSTPDGSGADICMLAALKDAHRAPEEIDYINAHGTSTLSNDRSETRAIKRVFGKMAHKIPISSNKSMLGHLIASSSAVELIISILTIQHNIIPPTVNLTHPDPECDLDYVPNIYRKKEVNTVLSNSFAFGGQNVSLIVERFVEDRDIKKGWIER